MELTGITEEQLAEYFFVEWPNDIPLDQCRERLELYIFEAKEAEDEENRRNGYIGSSGESEGEDEGVEPVISPVSILMAMRHRRLKWFDEQPEAKQRRIIARRKSDWLEKRQERRGQYQMILQTNDSNR